MEGTRTLRYRIRWNLKINYIQRFRNYMAILLRHMITDIECAMPSTLCKLRSLWNRPQIKNNESYAQAATNDTPHGKNFAIDCKLYDKAKQGTIQWRNFLDHTCNNGFFLANLFSNKWQMHTPLALQWWKLQKFRCSRPWKCANSIA